MTQEFGKLFSISRTVPAAEENHREYFRMSTVVSGVDTPSGTYHPRSDSTLLDGGQFGRIMAGKGCCLYFKLVWTAIGVLGGLSICLSFFVKYHNFHAASWGFAGGIMAAAGFHLHYLHCKDRLEDWHNQSTLTKIFWFGFVIFVFSTGGLATYIALALKKNQTYTLDDFSFWPAATFSFYTMKWSLALMWEARNYRQYLSLINPALLPAIPGFSTSLRI